MSAILNNIINGTTWEELITKLIIILCCIPIHECAHAWVAMKLGDYTAKHAGRITLNPFVHLDPWGTIMILAFGFGYAKPVSVNHHNFRNPKRDMAFVALAGPISNLLIANILLIFGKAVYRISTACGAYYILAKAVYCIRFAAYININLAIFNLIPIPPLDGFQVLLSILPTYASYKIERLRKYSVYIIFGLIIAFSYPGVSPVTTVTGKVYSALLAVFG